MSIVRFKNRSLRPSFFDDFFLDDFITPFRKDEGNVPATNVEETENEFILDMAIPGMKKEDINVEVENGSLCVSAETEETSEEKEKNYMRKEYSFSSFKRSFTLPENVTGEVSAKYEDGILKIKLPKREVELSAAKRIKVA